MGAPSLKLKVLEQERSCGPCSACCTTMGVSELNKPEHVACLHLKSPNGCGVYENRPKSCREFKCLWLSGVVENDELRPDLCGVVWTWQPNAVAKSGMFTAFESETGALNRLDNARLINLMIEQNHLVLLLPREGPRRFVGPPYKMERVLRVAAKKGIQGIPCIELASG
jgi:hypothetical protein